tara:strand:+ start:230 stop:994 length:765 start_codon:yes stop_codon:yes gene_type:complete
MENMQDILKKYYTSGGKDLFKEKLTEVDDTDSAFKFTSSRTRKKLDKNQINAVMYFYDKLPYNVHDDGPTFSIDAERELLAPYLDRIKDRWVQDVQDGTELEIKGKMRSNQKMFLDRQSGSPANLPTLNFTNFKTFNAEDSFLLEVMLFKEDPYLNVYNSPDLTDDNNKKKYVSSRFEYVPNTTGGNSMEPMIVVTAVSNYVEVFSAMVIVKELARFLNDVSPSKGDVKLSCRGTSKDNVFKVIADKLPGVTFV